MKYLFFILLGFAQTITFSQAPVLKFIDEDNKKEVPFVNIELKSLESNFQDIKTSDLYGKAFNTCDEKCTITISLVGYKTKVDTLKPNETKTYELESDYFNLEQVTITGTRTEKMLKDVPVLTQIITAEQLEVNGSIDIQDALSIALPSINFSKASTGKALKFQGLEAKYILFLIDGEKIAGETNGDIDYERLSTYNIERIEIIKGAASSLYGSNAIAGVVNIITKGTKQKVEGNVGSRYSTIQLSGINFQEFDLNANAGFRLKKISSRTDYHQKNDDGFILNSAQNNVLHPYNTKNISQKIQYTPTNKISIDIKGNYYTRNRIDPLTFSPKKDKEFSYGAKALYSLPNNNNVILSAYSDTYNTFYVNELYDNKETLLYSNKYDNARVIGNINIGDKQLFTIGSEFFNDNLFSDRIEGEKKTADNIVAFLQDDINFTDKLNTTMGVRFDWHSEYNFHFVPNISFMYKLSPFNIRLNYGLGFKAPTLKELYMDFTPVPSVKINGNSELIPETSHYYSASVEYVKAIVNTSVSVYQNRVTNMITEIRDVENLVNWSYENINNVIVSGIDLSLKARIKYGLSLTAGYSYVDSEDTSVGQQLKGIIKNSGLLILGHKLQLKKYKMTINLQSKFIGKVSFDEMNDLTGELTTKYFQANNMWKITTTHTFIKGIRITLGIDNIFNYTEIQDITSLNPGRSFFIGANINFNKLNFIN